MVGGPFDSSITRVRPFFCELLRRDPSGASWLTALLRLAPRYDDVTPGAPVRDPGRLDPSVVAPKRVGKAVLPACFEAGVAPPRTFLRWLIENPRALTWPERPQGVRVEYRKATQDKRERWFAGDAGVITMGLDELDVHGAAGSRLKWWAFEGFTSVDCRLSTGAMTVLVEGKRTESLSRSTDWFPQRNQLARNLEVAAESGDDHPSFVLLITEDDGPDLTDGELREGTPHLDDEARARLWSRYLGRCTWDGLCRQLSVGPLPTTSTAAEAAKTCEAVLRA